MTSSLPPLVSSFGSLLFVFQVNLSTYLDILLPIPFLSLNDVGPFYDRTLTFVFHLNHIGFGSSSSLGFCDSWHTPTIFPPRTEPIMPLHTVALGVALTPTVLHTLISHVSPCGIP